MRPKFEVGEVVLLRSEDFPECNGECTVLGMYHRDPVGYCYYLDFVHHVDGFADAWKESSLRKKHTPGELSFTDLMASLSSPKLITHQP